MFLKANSLAGLTEISSTTTSTGFGLSTETIVGNQQKSELLRGGDAIIPDIVGFVSLRKFEYELDHRKIWENLAN